MKTRDELLAEYTENGHAYSRAMLKMNNLQREINELTDAETKSFRAKLRKIVKGTGFMIECAGYYALFQHGNNPVTTIVQGRAELLRLKTDGCAAKEHIDINFTPDNEAAVLERIENIVRPSTREQKLLLEIALIHQDMAHLRKILINGATGSAALQFLDTPKA